MSTDKVNPPQSGASPMQRLTLRRGRDIHIATLVKPPFVNKGASITIHRGPEVDCTEGRNDDGLPTSRPAQAGACAPGEAGKTPEIKFGGFMADEQFTVQMDEQDYRICGPEGEEGPMVPYGMMATLQIDQAIFYCLIEDGNDENPVVYLSMRMRSRRRRIEVRALPAKPAKHLK